MFDEDLENPVERDSTKVTYREASESMEETELDRSSKLRERKVSDWLFTLAMVATLAVPFIACNLIYSWKEFGGGSRPGTEFQSHFRLSEMKIQAGGWPFVYHRHFELNGATFTYQSWMMLIANVLLASIFLVLVGFYVDRRRRTRTQMRFQITLWDGIVATLVLSPLLFAWTSERYAQNLESEAVGQAVSNIDPIRTRRIPTWMPDWMIRYCPIQWTRIESVAIERFPQLKPELLSNMRCVGAVSAKNKPLDVLALQSLIATNPVFEVYAQNSTLGKAQLAVLESAPRQVVIYSNGSGTSFGDFDASSRFENLVHFALLDNISFSGPFDWATHFPNLEYLQLPAPGANSYEVEVRGVSKLKSVRVDHLNVNEGMKPFSVTLDDLANLESIDVTPLAECDLKLKNLPLLTACRSTLNPAEGPTIFVNTPMERFPSGIAFRSVELRNCPSLESFDLFASKLKSLEMSGVPKLKAIGVDITYVKDMLQAEMDQHIVEVTNKYLSEEVEVKDPFGFQCIVDGVSGCENLEMINLSHVPMFGIDFSPLAKIPTLKTLHLASCALKPKDIQTLQGCKRLENLELTDNPIDSIEAGSFQGFDSLKSITLVQPLRSLVLSDLKELETFNIEFGFFIEEVVLKNLPKCNFQFGLHSPVQKLVLKDLPQLTSIAILAPLPEDLEVENLPGLKSLWLRDPSIDDSHLKKMKKLHTLDNLNLGTTNVTPKALAAAGRLPELEYLVLDSTKLSDEEVKSWSCLPKLKALDISETKVSNEGLRYILESCKLERLILAATSFSPETLALIAEQKQLSILSLRYCTLEDKDLQFLLKMPQLQMLDISGTNVSDATMTALVKLPKLKYLLAENCQQVRGDKFLQALSGLEKFMAMGLDGTLPEGRLQRMDTNSLTLLPPGWLESFWGCMDIEGLDTISAPAWRQLP